MHGLTSAVLELREPLLVLNLRCGQRESDIGEFGIARARPSRDLPKAGRGDCDADATEAPTQSSRLPPGQRPVTHQDVM
jgi:hypothetical protein